MDSPKGYHLKFIIEIKKHSKTNDYQKALEKWDFLDELEENDKKCICTHDICKVHYIVHKKKKNKVLPIGADCIKHFGFDDWNKKAERLDSLMKKYKSGWYDKEGEKIITFGKKYLGRTFKETRKDKNYVEWVLKQDGEMKGCFLQFWKYCNDLEEIEVKLKFKE